MLMQLTPSSMLQSCTDADMQHVAGSGRVKRLLDTYKHMLARTCSHSMDTSNSMSLSPRMWDPVRWPGVC